MQDKFNKDYAQLSPDGKWLAYQSDESGRPEIYVVSFPNPQGRWQVSGGGGRQPRWRRDGRALFFIAPDGKLMTVDVNGRGQGFETGTARAVLSIEPPLVTGFIYDVSPDGHRFLVAQAHIMADEKPLILIQNWPAELKQ
jgi:hypothetical protein